MTKIVYNACYGGFSLSHEAIMRYAEIKGITLYAGEGSVFGPHYYLCPEDEWARINAEELKQPVAPGRFDASSRLYFSDRNIERNDPALVQVVEELGDLANGRCADLMIVELPAGTQYRIDEYDGSETVATVDSYDWKIA
jgi:hypothetical protein